MGGVGSKGISIKDDEIRRVWPPRLKTLRKIKGLIPKPVRKARRGKLERMRYLREGGDSVAWGKKKNGVQKNLREQNANEEVEKA